MFRCCCSTQPGNSSPSTFRWHGRPTWTRWVRRCTRGVFAVGGGVREVAEAARWAPASLQPARRAGPAAGWPGAADHRGLRRRVCQCSNGRCRPSAAGTSPMRKECAGSGSSARSPSSAGTGRRGACFAARQVSLARDAGALVALSLGSHHAFHPCWPGPAISRLPRRCSKRSRRRSTRRPEASSISSPMPPFRLPPGRATKPRPWH